MTNTHIKEAVEKLNMFFFRCGTMPNYKGIMYVKNADNLKAMLEVVIDPVEKENSPFIKEVFNEEKSHIVYFKNGSHFSFLVVDGIDILGEQCHVMFVDNQIREHELRELLPVINMYEPPSRYAMLNPKPIYLNLS